MENKQEEDSAIKVNNIMQSLNNSLGLISKKTQEEEGRPKMKSIVCRVLDLEVEHKDNKVDSLGKKRCY